MLSASVFILHPDLCVICEHLHVIHNPGWQLIHEFWYICGTFIHLHGTSYSSIHSWYLYYLRFGKTNVRHTGILHPVSILTITVLSMSLFIKLKNFVQISPSAAEINRIEFQDRRCSTILHPVSDLVTSLSLECQYLSANHFRSYNSIHSTDITISGCRVLSLSDCKYSFNPLSLSQTRIDQVGRYRIRWTFKLSCTWRVW